MATTTNPIVRKDVAQILLEGAKGYTDKQIEAIPAFDVTAIAGTNLKVTSGKLGIDPAYTTSIDGKISTAKTQATTAATDAAKAYTDSKMADLVGGAPEALDTLKEIADYLDNDSDTKAGLVQQIAKKANAADVETKVNAVKATADAANTLATTANSKADTNEAKIGEVREVANQNTKDITALKTATSDVELKKKYPNLAADLSLYATKTQLADYVKASELEALAMTSAEATALVKSIFGA